MRTNFIKVKLIIFLTATFLFIGCSSAETSTDLTDSTNPTNPTYAIDGCGYSLPDIGVLGDFYDGISDPDYRNFQWSRASDNSYFGIQITEGPTTNEVGYIYLEGTNGAHGHLFRSPHSNGFGDASIIVYSTLTFASKNFDGVYTGDRTPVGQVYTDSLDMTHYISDQGLAAYTYGASNLFSGNSNYDFGTTGYRDGVFLGRAEGLELDGDAYYTHNTPPAATTIPTEAAIVKKQESAFFFVPCDANQFNSTLSRASLVNESDTLPDYRDTYPAQ